MKYIKKGCQYKLSSKCESRLFANRPFLLALHGKCESGKSTFILELLGKGPIKKNYGNRVYIASNSKSTLTDYYNRLVQVRTFTNNMTPKELKRRLVLLDTNELEKLKELVEHITRTSSPDRMSLLILDNVNGSPVERPSKFTNSLYTEFRQNYFSVIKANNSYRSLPPTGRRNATVVVMSSMNHEDMDLCVTKYCPCDMTYKEFDVQIKRSIKEYPYRGINRWSLALAEVSPGFPSKSHPRVRSVKPIVPRLPTSKKAIKTLERLIMNDTVNKTSEKSPPQKASHPKRRISHKYSRPIEDILNKYNI